MPQTRNTDPKNTSVYERTKEMLTLPAKILFEVYMKEQEESVPPHYPHEPLTDTEDIYKEAIANYLEDDVELNRHHFNYPVKASMSTLLAVYAEVQKMINGNVLVRTFPDGSRCTSLDDRFYEDFAEAQFSGSFMTFLECVDKQNVFYRIDGYDDGSENTHLDFVI